MNNFKSSKENLFSVTQQTFEEHALQLFKFQAKNNLIYKQYLQHLNAKPESVDKLTKIPFLPIEFFKYHDIKSNEWETQAVFESSGTTGQVRSKHFIEDIAHYLRVTEKIFNRFYGSLTDFHFFALLPSYLENENSSLIKMVDFFIKQSKSDFSGFYLNDKSTLVNNLLKAKGKGRKVILMGVSFALLDLAEECDLDLSHVIIIETGGMKGRRQELTRMELHKILKDRFKVKNVHSEYGMTELLSQAYSLKDGEFECPPWLRFFVRDTNDPFDMNTSLKAGGLNVIDLANVQSCAFIETQDLVRKLPENKFEMLGRIDNSDIRGCNLLTF